MNPDLIPLILLIPRRVDVYILYSLAGSIQTCKHEKLVSKNGGGSLFGKNNLL
jgi:hypothetical protein